jgi:hypothetical protein
MTDAAYTFLILAWAFTAQLWLNARQRARAAEARAAEWRKCAADCGKLYELASRDRDELRARERHLRLRTRGIGDPLRYDDSLN